MKNLNQNKELEPEFKIGVDKEHHRTLKIEAAKRGITMKELIHSLIAQLLMGADENEK